MRSSLAVPSLVACVIASLCTAGEPAGAGSSTSIEAAAASSMVEPAERSRPAGVGLDSSIREIAVVGDSILAESRVAGSSPNDTVQLVHDALRSRPGTADVAVRNLAAPGVATRFPAGPGFGTLDNYLRAIFPETENLPDLVIVAVSSIDLNARPDVPVTELGPAIISELDRVARYLEERGARTVFVPAFGANSELFNQLKNATRPTFRDYGLNTRIEGLNRLLVASELPLLFDRFRRLDVDGDGSADRRYFVGRTGQGEIDDGVHPNALGQREYAANLTDALAGAFERG